MKLRKILTGVVLSALVLSVAAGCGNKKEESSETDQVELRISWWGGDTRHEAMRSAIAAFEEENPNIKVKAEYTGFDGYQEKFTTQLSGGTAPDVARIDAQWLDQYKNHLVDLNTLSDIIQLDNFDQNNLESVTLDDSLLGVPLSTIYMPLYYNKTVLDEYGIEPPKTWDDIIAMRDKLPEDVYPLYSGYGPKVVLPLFLFRIMAQQTGTSPGDSENKLVYTEEDFKAGVEYYNMLVEKNIIPSKKVIDNAGIVDGSPNPGLVNGKWLMFFQWDSSAGVEEQQLAEGGYEMAVTDYPTMADGKSTGAFSKPSALFSIPKSSKHPEEAAKLIDFLLNDEKAIAEIKLENGYPDSTSAQKTVEELDLITPLAQESHDIGKAATDPELAFVYKWQRARTDDTCLDVFTKLDYGEITVDEAAKELYQAFKDEENNFME